MDAILEAVQGLGMFFSADLTKYGALISGLVGVYKIATGKDRKARARERAYAKIDDEAELRMLEVVDEHLGILRGQIYAAAVQLVTGASRGILAQEQVYFKSCPVTMPHSTLLEKIDVAIKDVISRHLTRHILRDWEESEYHSSTEMDREGILERHSKHLRDILWLKISKDAGLSEILKTAYESGAAYEVFRALVEEMYAALEVQEKQRQRKREAYSE